MNSQETFSSVTLSSNATYKDITSIEFTPMRKLNLKKVVDKGSTRYWKWLGILPLFAITNREDLYTCEDLFWDYEKRTWDSIKWYIDNHSNWYMIKDKEVYHKAEVTEKHLNGKDKTYFFTTNQDAMNKVNLLKKYCEECGNTLR